jgi:hypothetical protein
MGAWWRLVVVCACVLGAQRALKAAEKTARPSAENLVIVTFDGVRWQEVFGGAESILLDTRPQVGGVQHLDITKKKFWRETPTERREALMPFLWGTMVKQGQLFGDPAARCEVAVTNGKSFSYPGYTEMLCGVVDERITSNDKLPNANVSVLEALNNNSRFRGNVAVFSGWDVMPYILNTERSKLNVVSGWEDLKDEPLSDLEKQMNVVKREFTRVWPQCTFDAFITLAATEHIKKHQPSVIVVNLGETDEWAHLRRYDMYLETIYNSDRFVGQLWEMLQGMDKYKGKTALMVCTDHGRGKTWVNWVDHNNKTPGSDRSWVAVMGPETPALGVREDLQPTLSQFAATAAQLVGEEFHGEPAKAAAPLAGVLKD